MGRFMGKLKILLIAVATLVIKCKSYLIPEDAGSVRYFVPIVNLREVNESIIYFKDNNLADDDLKNSILLGLYPEQPVVLTNRNGYKNVTKGLWNSDSNIILLTESLNINDIQTPQFVSIFRSYWSPVYIILTAKNALQTCGNGTVNKVFFENAEKYMNELWQRYRSVRALISFPYTCPHHFIIFCGKKPSSTVYDRTIKVIKAKDKKELKTTILQNSRLSDLTEQYPLRGNIFLRFPTSIPYCDNVGYYMKANLNYSNGFCGMDGLIMHDFIQHYKFKLHIPEDERCNRYGYTDPESNISTGSLRCVLRNKLDISFNSRFLVQYTNEHHYYLHIISQDSLCVILKRPNIIALWHYAYNIFNLQTWTFLFLLIITMSIITWGIAFISKEVTGKKPGKLYSYILNSIACTLFGLPIGKPRERYKIFTGTSLLCSIIFLALYQGNVNYQFTTRTRERQIETLHQLYQSKNVLVTSPSLEDLLRKLMRPEDKDQVKYIQNIKIKGEDVGIEAALEADTGAVFRGQDSQIEILLNYTDETGSPMLYVVDECFQIYYLSFIARNGFLFVEESLRFMMRMLEAGLPNKYYVWTKRTLKLEANYPRHESEPRPFAKIKLSNVRVAFGIMALGYIVSTCAFIVERHIGKKEATGA